MKNLYTTATTLCLLLSANLYATAHNNNNTLVITEPKLTLSQARELFYAQMIHITYFNLNKHLVDERMYKERPIHKYARQNNLHGLQYCLKNNPSAMGMRDTKGNTPLMLAVLNGHLKIIRLLLQYPAINIDLTEPSYLSKSIKPLDLPNIHKVDKKNRQGKTPLEKMHELFEEKLYIGSSPLIEAFIKAGAQCDHIKRNNGIPLLHWLIEYHKEEAIDHYLRYNSPNVTHYSEITGHHTSLTWTMEHKNYTILEKLVKHPRIDITYMKCPLMNTALLDAIWANDSKAVKILLQNPNIDIYQKNSMGYSPCSEACRSTKEIYKLLLSHEYHRVDKVVSYIYRQTKLPTPWVTPLTSLILLYKAGLRSH